MSRMFTFILIGVAIGVLIAPDKGSVTRSRLSDILSDLSDQAKDIAGTVKGKVDDLQSNL